MIAARLDFTFALAQGQIRLVDRKDKPISEELGEPGGNQAQIAGMVGKRRTAVRVESEVG